MSLAPPPPVPSQSHFQPRLLAFRFALEQVSPLVTQLNDVAKVKTTNHQNDHIDHSYRELATEIDARLISVEDELRVLQTESVTGAADHADLAYLNTLEDHLKRTRVHFLRAQLQAKRSRDAPRLRNRETLYAGTLTRRATVEQQPPSSRRRHLTEKDLVATASSDITVALQRTHRLMVSELSRSEFANKTLEQSSEALSSLNSSYAGLDSLLASSRALVRSLMHTQKSDTWYLETTVYVLIGTIAWLVFRRLLYGPIWWILWFPIKMPLKAVFEVISFALLYLQRFLLFSSTESAVYKNLTALATEGKTQKASQISPTPGSLSLDSNVATPNIHGRESPVIQTHSHRDEGEVLNDVNRIASKQTVEEVGEKQKNSRNPHKRIHVENLRDEL